jgi:endonuclease/exonuclease/phosphatase family metal-dependent hydrolase
MGQVNGLMAWRKLGQMLGLVGILAGGFAHASTLVLGDSYNVTGAGAGFALGNGLNSGINPPTTRLTGTAAANLRYINTGDKSWTVYSIAANRIQVAAATNVGRFVLSADGKNSFDFAPALGTAAATPTSPVVYDLSIRMNNASVGNQRFSIALGTAEGDVDTWAFGVQVYRESGGDNFYTLGKRVDTGASGLGSDLNTPITTLTGNTFGNDITVLMRVTDAGAESSAFHSRVQVSLNGGNSWCYDTDSDADLPNGWRFNGPGRHIIWHVSNNAGPVTYDAFTLKLNPPANNLNPGATFKVMTYNIHFGTFNGEVNTQNTANYILDQQADLVVLNEVDRFKSRTDNRDLIGELAKETGMNFVFSNNIPYASNDEFGNAILSKYPILFRDHRLLPKVGDNEQRGWLKAIVDVNGKFLSFWATHLDFHENNTERLMCVTNFNTWVADEAFPVMLCGDFNDTGGSTVHTRMELKWQDAWELAPSGGSGQTVPCPGPTGARIDYIWKAKTANLTASDCFVGGLENSDHYPVLSSFTLNDFTNHVSGFYFPFNEGSGTKTTDAVGGLSGTLGSGTPVWNANSPWGQPGDSCLYFDGTRKLTLSDPKQIIGTNGLNDDYTLQAWVKVAVDYAPPQRAILFQYERRPGFSFSLNTNRTLHTTTFKIKDISSTATLPNDGQWHHVAVVHSSGANMKFYIDAALAATVSYKSGAGYRTSPTITLGSASEGANPFTGYLDRVRFDSRALTPAEFDYPAGPNRPPVVTNELVTVTGDAPAALTLAGADPDGDPVTFQLKSAPLEGLVTGFNATNGSLVYLPARGFRGLDRLTFTASDGLASSSVATLTLSVVAPADTNANGLPDAWEALYGLNDPHADADGDGQSNLAEYLANTNPTNAASALRIIDAGWQTNGQFRLTWSSVGGTRYRVQYSDRAVTGPYTEFVRFFAEEMDPSPLGEPSSQSFTDPFTQSGSLPSSGRFYRVQVIP